MSRSGEQVQQVTGLLSSIDEDGVYIPPEGDDYTPDVDNSGIQEIEEDVEDIETEDQEIDQEEVEENEEDTEVDEEQETEEGSEVQTINELANFLEVEESQLYDIQIPLGDGLDPVTIGSLKDGYMEIERSRAQLSNDRAALEQEVEQYKNSVQQAGQLPMMNEELMNAAVEIESIRQQYSSIDWDAFEQQDPTRAMLHRQKLDRAYQVAQDQYTQITQGYAKQQQDAMKNMKAQSRAKILDKIPEWKDPKVFQKEGDLIGNILVNYGYTPKEISEVYDPRLSVLLRDFMILKTKSEKAGTTVKKLRLAPKKLPSSGTPAKKVIGKARLNKTIENAKKSRDVRDKVGAVSQLLNNS